MKNDAIRQFVRRELRAVTVGAVATAIGMGGGLPAAMANPVGGAVVSGQGSITSPNTTTTLINQQSNSLILNWSSFNVASNETVQFVQPSSTSVALNNILSQSPSQIFGKIDANGRVVLINPNGILFGRTAQLNVGSLIASSLELKEFDPTTGHLTFQSLSGSPGVIDNEGTITAGRGGSVALLGGTVLNNGLVVADYGTVAMGAGNVATLDFYGGGLLRLQVSGDLKSNSTGAAAAVQNNGQIQANGGQVVLTATATKDVFASAVNNTGVIRANRVENVGGVIELSGPDGVVANSGTLDASGKGAGSTGGTVKVVGNDVGLFGTSTINASGPAGGGTVLVGGGFHGTDSSVQDASRTYVGADTTIDADATSSGNGGNVAVWSNDGTRYYGNISAQGGGQGSGGYTEVSGKAYLDYEGLVDLRAPSGKLGTLLLDPAEITIEHGVNGTDTNIVTTGTGPFADTSGAAGSILVDGTINTQLATADVTVTTSGLPTDTDNGILISNTAGTVVLGPATADASKLTLNSASTVSWDSGWSYTNNGQLTLYAADGSISANATGEPIAIGGTSPVLMQASAGVGSSAIPVETTGLTSVAADGGTGGVYISNGTTGAVTVDTLTNPATAGVVSGLNATATAVSLVNNAGAITLNQPVAAGTGSVTLEAVGGALDLGANNVSGAGVTLEGVGVTQALESTVDAGAGDILVDGGGGAVNMASLLTTTSNTATAVTVKDATTVALPGITTGATGTTTIGASITGAVTQNIGTAISTGTLAGHTTGSVTLGKANTITTVGAFTSNGFTLNVGNALGITGTLAGGAGGVDLTSSGTISETGSGLITTTGTLTTSSAGDTTLGGANAVAALNATNATSGNFNLTNTAALNITAFTPVSGGSVTIDNAGGTTLGTAINAGTGSVTLKDTTGTLALGTNNVSGGGVTLQGKGVTQSAGSTVDAGAGDILVDGGGGAVNMAGALTTTSNTATAATVKDATTVALPSITTGTTTGTTTIGAADISGAVTQNVGTTITTATLTGNTTGTVTLGNTNTIPTLGAFASAGFTLKSGDPLSITGTLAGGAGGVDLTSSGAISESGAGLITTTGGLTTSSAGDTTLSDANVVNSFNATNTTSGNVSLTNGRALIIAGMSQAAGGSITVNNAGGTTLNVPINAGAGSVTLKDTTGTLALGTNNVSGAGVTLQGVGVTQLAASTVNAGAGDILVDGGGGAVNMAGALTTTSNTATAATVKDATTVALPSITTGTTTGTTTIGAADISGAVTQNVGTTITTATLTGNTTGTVTLGNMNTIPTLGAFASAGFTLNDGDPLSITGTLAGGVGAVHLTSTGTISETGGGLISTTNTLTTHSAGGTMLGGSNALGTFGATNTGGTVTLVNAAGLTITGLSQTGGGLVSVTNTTPITLSGTNTTDGALSLISSGGGVTLGSTAGDVLTVGGTLSVSANGSITEQTGSSATATSSQLTLTSPTGDLILKSAATLGPITLVGTGRNLDLEGTNQTQISSILGSSPTWTGAITLIDAGAAISLPHLVAGGALAVTAPGISQSGLLSVGTTTTLTATGNQILLAGGNTFTGEVDFTGSNITLASTGSLISAGTATGNLSETAGGKISEGAAGIKLTGTPGANTATFTVTGAPDDVDLGSTANNFNTDAVEIAAGGTGVVGNVRVVDANPTSLSVALPGTLTSLVLSDTHAPIMLAGGTFTGVTGFNLAGGTTTLAVTAGGAITQTSALLVTGMSAFSANGGASNITLSNTGNAFSGGVTLAGNNVTVANTVGTTVGGASTAGNLTLDAGGAVTFGTTGTDSTTVTGNLVAQGLSGSGATGGAVTQAGTLSVVGTTSINASNNDITLSNPGNSFTGAVTLIGGTVTLANSRATLLGGGNNAGSLTLDAGGAVTFGTVSTDSTTVANDLIVQGASGGGAAGGAVSLAETVDVGGTLYVTAPGISQSAGPLVVAGTTTLTSSGNPISLTDAGNSFGGEVDFVGSAVTLTSSGPLVSAGTASGDLSETAAGKISEGAAGIQLTGTAGTNTATFTVTGGTQDVDLDPANNFNGEATTITASGGGAVGNVAVEDTYATFVPLTLPATFTSLVLSDPNAPIAIAGVTLTGVGAGTNLVGGTTTLAVTAGGAITQTGALSVTGTSAFNSGASDINLSNAANAFNGGILLTGNNVTLANTVATTVAGTSAAGNLTLDAGGAVSQTGALTVAGTTSIDAGTNAITLANAANALAGSVTLTGGAVTLANSRAITLAGANSAGSLTLDAGGAVAFGAAGSDSTTVTNGLIVQGVNGSGAAGAVTQAGKLSVGTTASITAGANDITLGLANTFGGNVAFAGRNVTLTTGTGGLMSSGTASGNLTETSAGSITQGGALSVTGRAMLTANGGSGDITLATASNAFAGPVTLSGGAVTLANADATTLAGTERLGSLTLDAGGAVTFGTVSTDTTTVTNALIVQGVSGSGNAGGAITQIGTLSVGTTTLIQAGANDITLGLMNTFGGGVTFNGRNVLLNAKGSLTTVTGTASGTLTAIAQGASANLNVGNLTAGGDLLLIAGSSILGTSAQATVTATDAQVRYGLEDANGQLGSATNPSQQIGFQAAPGASQVQLTVWLPSPGTQLQNTDLRPTQSDLTITKQAFSAGEQAALYSPNFGLTAAQVAGTSAAVTVSFAGTQTQSAVAQSAATQGAQSVLYIDWGSYNPNVSLFGTLNPAVCLPADQRDESAGSGSGCAAASASLLKPPAPIQLAMVPTQEGWKTMPLFRLAR